MDSAENLPELPVSYAGIEKASEEVVNMIHRLFTDKLREAGLYSNKDYPAAYYSADRQVHSLYKESSRGVALLSRSMTAHNAHLFAYGYRTPISRIPHELIPVRKATIRLRTPTPPCSFYGNLSDSNNRAISLLFKDTKATRRYVARLQRKVRERNLPLHVILYDGMECNLTLSGHVYYNGNNTSSLTSVMRRERNESPTGVSVAEMAVYKDYTQEGYPDPQPYLILNVYTGYDDLSDNYAFCNFAEMSLELDSFVKVVNTLTQRYLSEDQIEGMYRAVTPVERSNPTTDTTAVEVTL